jgi:all-trans-nonaprenyl-diphosphate synthase
MQTENGDRGMTTQQSSFGTTVVSPPDITTLLEPIRDELVLVEEWLNSNLVDDSSFIEELLGQVFKAGGKRIRPALCLLSAKASATPVGKIGRLQIILAVLTELIHTASLVHDDVIDSASLRRGQETVNRRWNEKLAVLIGDLLFAQASVCLSRLMNPAVVGIYGQVLGDLCAGEIRQMRQQFSTSVDFDAYIQKSVWKTASLFAAGTHSAPILNGCGDDVVAAMKDYGLNLGICFQIVDDLLDYTGSAEKLGKAAGSDLSQGVVTAPALHVLGLGNDASRRLEAIIKNREVATPDGLAEAISLIEANGGISATVQIARDYAAKARAALQILPASPYRDSMDGIVDWLLTRTS